MNRILTPQAFEAEIEKGAYAWPGGYPRYFICTDGECMCFSCAVKERKLITEAEYQTGWELAACEINWETEDMFCVHCNQKIESAYGED